MSISYNYFLPTNIFGTLRVTDLGFPGYTAVNANIYCQRNINCDGQMQCGQFHALGTAYFDQVPTCVINATTATQLTNYQTVQGLISASGGITAQQAIDAVHASSQQFTVPQNIWNTLTFRAAGGSLSTTVLQHSDTIGYFIFTNTSSTGHYRFNVNTAGIQSSVLEMDSTLFIVRAGNVQLNLTTVNALTCSNNATFNGAYPTTTLGPNSGLNNNEFCTVGYANSISGTSILGLNNTFTGTNTFQIPIVSSGASITTNTIPAASLVNNSLTNSQVATGFQLVTTNSQTFAGVKTLSSLLNSTGITDSVSISTPIMNAGYFTATSTGGTSTLYGTYVNGQLSANSLNTNLITNSSTTLPYHIQPNTVSLPTTTTGDPRAGFLIGWNGLNGSSGETDFTNLNQGGNQGGFLFGNIPVGGSYQKLVQISPSYSTGLRIYPQCGQIQVDDNTSGAFSTNILQNGSLSVISSRGINTTLFLQCGNGVGTPTNVFQVSPAAINPLVPTTFNAFHPTTSLGNNISTNTTQYSTVGYVNSVSGTALLASNNTWTGTNLFRNSTGGITTSLTGTLINNYFGCGSGGAGNLVMGGNSLGTVNALNTLNIAICPTPNACLQNNIGNNNIAIGNASGNVQTSANRNIYVGTQCGTAVTGANNICIGGSAGNGITSGTNNIAIGDSAWTGANTFSNCTVIGAGALAPDASNQIVLGRTTDTVLIRGASQINDTLMTGTSVVSNNMQVNGNIIQPVLSFTVGVNTTFTSIPPYILYLPAASMNFTFPVPSASNAGMQFIIRRTGVGSSSTVSFLCIGSPAVWVTLNANAGITSFAVSSLSASQSMWFSSGTLFYQLI